MKIHEQLLKKIEEEKQKKLERLGKITLFSVGFLIGVCIISVFSN